MPDRNRPHGNCKGDTEDRMNPLVPVRAHIQDVKSETDDVKTYVLSTGNGFRAMPGQFNMLGYPGVGESPISLSSVVRNGTFTHTVRAVGRATEFLGKLQPGDDLFLRGPYGKGWPLGNARGGDILLVAGGIGLAPLRPVVQAILAEREAFGNVSLIYGAKSEKSVLFMDEFGDWGKGISLFLTVDEVSRGGSWEHDVGLVTDLLYKVNMKPAGTIAFVCGPEIMMRLVCSVLLLKDTPQSRMYVSLERRMKCGIAQCGNCQHYGLFVCKDGPVFSYAEVRGLPDGFL